MDKVGAYLSLLTQALQIGQGVYTAVRGIVDDHASDTLTPQEYKDLKSRWTANKLRAAANAGINAATGQPFIPPAK